MPSFLKLAPPQADSTTLAHFSSLQTLAQTDHKCALPKRQILNDACVISIYVQVAPGRALVTFAILRHVEYDGLL